MNTYKRPMAGWWLRNPYYRWYMLRELSCVFITAYALILLLGLYRLAQGPDSFALWQAALATPGALVFHVVALVLVVYHSWTWFRIMPKTLPRIPLPDWAVVTGGITAVVLVSAALLWAAIA